MVPIDVGADLVAPLQDERPEIAFVALHGPGGEDGTVQELLEILGIPYTGPRRAACVRSIDKVAAKHRLRAAGVPTPDWAAFNAIAFRELGAADTLVGDRGEPRLPPGDQAGAPGVGPRACASRPPPTRSPRRSSRAFSYDDRVLLERHVEGRELAISLINGIALPVVEALPLEADRFNYEARYEIGRTDYVCPADSRRREGPILDAALRTWDVLGFDGFCRVDLILARGRPQVLEANAIPGLTDTSLLPMAAEAAGLASSAWSSAWWSWRWSASRRPAPPARRSRPYRRPGRSRPRQRAPGLDQGDARSRTRSRARSRRRPGRFAARARDGRHQRPTWSELEVAEERGARLRRDMASRSRCVSRASAPRRS